MAELFANNTSTTVSSGGTTAPASGTAETWTVASSASFPAASSALGTQFHVADPALPAEKIAVTNVSGTTWTVTRGAESTTPAAHAAGFTVVQVVTAGPLAAFVQNPMTTLGDLIYENATPAPARLAADTSNARRFLRTQSVAGAPQAPAWDLLQASDIPQLSQYNPIGLTGATAPTSYAGGTVSGHPLSGTWTQGQWIADQQGHIYACVAGGTPGTWRRVGADPWQFFLDDYCKADGRQCLVSVTNGSTTINSTPLAAPAAPVPTQTTTGGTVGAGVIGVINTYVNRWGETLGSVAGTVTTTTGTSTVTVPSPPPSGNATAYYSYVTQPGGATYFRQQAAGSPTAIEVPLVLTAQPTTTGANPPGADTSAAQLFTSTAVDGGKNIMINGALGSPAAPLIDTIATVNSPTQAVLSSVAATATVAGCAMVFASDDRLNVDACLSDAKAYALANSYFYQVIGGAKIIGLGTGVFQSVAASAAATATYGFNTQVRLSPAHASGQTEKLEGQLLGPGDNAHCEFWVSQLPNLTGLNLVSFAMGPATADATFGQQSVIGGPQNGPSYNGSSGFANMKAVIRGVSVIQPGWCNTIGIDLQFIAGFRLNGRVAVYAPATATGGGINPSNGWVANATWQGKIGAALRAPNEGNNDDCVIESLAIEGQTNSILSAADHLDIGRLATINVYFGFKLSGMDANDHDLTIAQWSPENCTGGLIQAIGGGGGHCKLHVVLDGETAAPVYDIQDNSNMLYGDVWWSDPFRAAGGPATVVAPIIQGGANLRVHNRMLARQVFGAPTYTLGTALQNPWWDPMLITLSGGTVTGVLIGPTSAACTTSVATATPVTFKLPAGWWVNIQGTVKPTTFIAVPD